MTLSILNILSTLTSLSIFLLSTLTGIFCHDVLCFFDLYHVSRSSSPLLKNASIVSDGIPFHSKVPRSATLSAGEKVLFCRALRSDSNSDLGIAYLCLDCSMIFLVCSLDHSGLGSGIVFIENGSEVTPLIIILVYAVNLGSEIRSFGVTSSLN